MEKRERKPSGYWTYERCKEEAKKYSGRNEFHKNCVSAYNNSFRNGWLDEFYCAKQLPKGYWTYEHCKEEAMKYETRSKFHKGCKSAYSVAWKKGWIDDWFNEVGRKPMGYWDCDHCKEEALKYDTRYDFRYNNVVAYEVARDNGWLDGYFWLKKRGYHKGDDYWIYAYEDVENKAVYVGLTWRKERHNEHKRDKKDRVNKYFKSINKPVPEPMIKIEGLSAEDAQYYEDWYKKKYAEAGWKVLNKGKTGVGSSSLGRSYVVWDYEHCKEEASKYRNRTEFQRNSVSAYSSSNKNGWLDDFFGKSKQNKPNYWTYDKCEEIALGCKTRTELREKNGTAYVTALKKGWIDDYTWFVTLWEKKWNKETCYEEARKYKTKKAFQIGSPGAYDAVLRNKWMNDYDWFEEVIKPRNFWNYNNCREEASKYNRRVDFRKYCKSAYNSSRKNGWIDEFFPKAA